MSNTANSGANLKELVERLWHQELAYITAWKRWTQFQAETSGPSHVHLAPPEAPPPAPVVQQKCISLVAYSNEENPIILTTVNSPANTTNSKLHAPPQLIPQLIPSVEKMCLSLDTFRQA